jgi:hypothetical protein
VTTTHACDRWDGLFGPLRWGAGAVAILSAPDNFDAALVIVNADSTGRTKRERLIKANPFLEHFTVADLKGWAERKMRGPTLRLAEADTKP